MSVRKGVGTMRKLNFNYVDSNLHTSTHAKPAFYSSQNHEDYENKGIPINANTLNYRKPDNLQLIASLYTDKEIPDKPSSEFKSCLFYFYVYLSLSLLSILSFITYLYYSEILSSAHFQIHLICIIVLILSSFSILLFIQRPFFLIKAREIFLGLAIVSYLYFILADERILCKLTGEDYNPANQIPLVLGIVTLSPMLRLVLFDYFLFILISGIFAVFTFLTVHLSLGLTYRYSELSEIALLSIFLIIQIIETHKNDLRIKQIFWRKEKEVVLNKAVNLEGGFKSAGINSDVDLIMEICETMKKRLKDISKVIMFHDIKKSLKESVCDIEKIKWKVAHRQDLRVIIDPEMDHEDRKYIEQNFVDAKRFKSDDVAKVSPEIHEAISFRVGQKISLFELEGALSALGTNWNFDIWFFYDTSGGSISLVSKYLISKWDFFDQFSIAPEISQNFFVSLEKGYKPNPYHNSCHAADVLSSLLFFLMNSDLMQQLNSLEIFASLVATLGHDVGHPGVTNRFLVNNKDELAYLYNDSSVLENMHCSTIYSLMRKPGCDIFSGLSIEDWAKARSLIVSMVLATDMSKHFEVLGEFRARLLRLKDLEIRGFEDKTLILSMALKCADLGHSAKTTELHQKWSFLVCDELFAQGDLERDRFQPVSMYCDRQTTDIDKSQAGFLKNICIPLYEVWGIYLNSQTIQKSCIDQQHTNQQFWEERARKKNYTSNPITVKDAFTVSFHRISTDKLK